ncbi:uracil-DNA glycosylase family protein [Vibrio sp. F74]|uniref:uracil-DNA glycosylase family protein n=1 Tax=Vibrio sp. F74 TaxID=700020 RepID=UPI0035F59BE6
MNISDLLTEIKACKLCESELELGANPVIQADEDAKILIIGQAPGVKVHRTSIPWNDPSGDRLRGWLNIDKNCFYDPKNIAIMPMGFCYPGKGKNGDLPPRKECAPLWHRSVLSLLPKIELTLLIGQYSQHYYLPDKPKTLTETVHQWHRWSPSVMPLPHPSPRNTLWLRKNPWFEEDIVKHLAEKVEKILSRKEY